MQDNQWFLLLLLLYLFFLSLRILYYIPQEIRILAGDMTQPLKAYNQKGNRIH